MQSSFDSMKTIRFALRNGFKFRKAQLSSNKNMILLAEDMNVPNISC